jgi:hypothetical protein
MLEVTHVQLPMDGEVWRCEWFGEVRTNPAVPLELEISVAFRRLESDWSVLIDAEIRSVWIGMGSFCSIRLGSLWRDGRLLSVGTWTTEEFFVDFATPRRLPVSNAAFGSSAQSSVKTFGSLRIPDTEHDQPVILANTLGAGRATTRPKVAIPLHEIARTWYLRDSEITLRILSQPFPYALDLLYDARSSTITSSKLRLAIRPGISAGSVPIIGMLASNAKVILATRSLIDRIVAAKLSQGRACLDVMPPSIGRTRIIATGEWKEVLRIRTFFVYSLVGIELPKMPSIEWFRSDGDNDVELVAGNDDSESTDHGSARVAEIRVTNFQEPSTRAASVSVFIQPAEFLNLPLIERHSTPNKLKRTVHLTAHDHVSDSCTSEEVASGSGTSPADGVRSVRFEATTTMPADNVGNQFLAAGFESMIDLARRLGTIEGLRVNSARGADFLDDISGFTRTLMTKELTWARIGDRRRRALCIEIQYEDVYYYVVEVERRFQKEELSSCLVGRKDGKQFETGDLDRVLNECAQHRGSWSYLREPYWYRTLAHKFKGVETMASKILKLIRVQ